MHLSVIRRKIRMQWRSFSKLLEPLFSRSYFKALFLLNVISIVNLYSVAGKHAVIMQSCVFCFGTLCAIVISNYDYLWLKRLAVPMYIFVCGLVISVSIIGTRVNGARRWIKLAGFTLQPTELLKVALIVIIAFYIDVRLKAASREKRDYNLWDLIIPLALMITPLVFVLKQPDLGTAIICVIIVSAILFFMGIEKKTLLMILVLSCAGGYEGWNHLKPYQRDRVATFLNPDVDYRGKNWQSHQSLIAFGSGGYHGRGFHKGPETQLGYLPEHETDFALSSLAEEHGFVAVAVVLLLINFLIVRLLLIARHARDKFSTVVVIGVTFWIGFQALINTGMVIGLLPVVGVPFPVISYGGSSLLSILIAFGFIANTERGRRTV